MFSDFQFLAKAMSAVGAAVFLTDRLLVDRLLRWWKRQTTGQRVKDDGNAGWIELLAVQLLWAMFMGGRCLCIGGRHMLNAGPIG